MEVTGTLEVFRRGKESLVVLAVRPPEYVLATTVWIIGVLGEEVTLGLPDATVEDECPTTTDP